MKEMFLKGEGRAGKEMEMGGRSVVTLQQEEMIWSSLPSGAKLEHGCFQMSLKSSISSRIDIGEIYPHLRVEDLAW
jgi:hypothetical protein